MIDRAHDIADQALRLSSEEREAFVRRSCGEQETLYRLVMGLLTDPGRVLRSGPPATRRLHAPDAPGNPLPDAVPSSACAPASSGSGGVDTRPAAFIDRLADDFAERVERIGPYRLVKQLGAGGMGVVWMATRDDTTLAQRVAIKLIRAMPSEEAAVAVVKRFELERQVLGAMNHPNIARLIGAGRLPAPDNRPYLVMEYVEGEPINEYSDRMELTVAQRIRLFQKVCAAVHHAHQNLVVHRDIKPTNILVSSEGEPKLMDFGIAKILNVGLASMTLATREGHSPMTPEYASPEQVLGKPIGTASDVYSLGALLYELLTGRRPYRLKDRALDAVVRAVAEQEPERPSTVVTRDLDQLGWDGAPTTITADHLARPREGSVNRLKRRLSGDLDNIVLMAMRKSPQRRYASAAALAEDLQRHLDGDPVRAREENWAYVAGRTLQRYRLVVGAAAAVLLVTSAAAVFSWSAWRRERVALTSERAAREAEGRARADAEKRLVQVRELATGFLRDLQKRVERHRGATESLTLLSETSLQLLEKLAAEFPGDPRLEADLSDGYALLARAIGPTRGPGQGDSVAALDLIRRSIAIRRRHLGDPPATDAARRLAAALVLEADYLRQTGRSSEARRSLDEAVRLTEPGEQADTATARTLATALLDRADLSDAAASKDAFADLERSFAIRRRLYEADRDDPQTERLFTVGLSRMADLAASAGDDGRAEDLLYQSLAIRERRHSREPSARTERDVATAAGALGRLLVRRGGRALDRAEPLLVRQRDIFLALERADPSHARGADDTLGAMIDLAALAGARMQSESALRQWHEAANRARTLAEGSPADAARRLTLARTLEHLAHAQAAADESPVASISAAIAALEKLPASREVDEHIARLRQFLRDAPR